MSFFFMKNSFNKTYIMLDFMILDSILVIERGKYNIHIPIQAEGKPDPEILWFKHDAPVIQSSSVKVVNDGTELRINR